MTGSWLAGCSSDEKEVDNGLQGLKSSDMIVSLEELTSDEEEDASTRSFMSRDMKTHLWVEDDEMRVYDPLMVRYDIYKFGYKDDSRQTGVFSRVMEESFYSEAPTFAFFSNQDVEGGYFDRDRTTYEPFLSAKFYISADMNGSQPMAFATTQSGGTTFFSDWLPRWGEVTKVEDGQALHTSMKFLTGVLRLQLANTGGKADLVKVQMLSGGTKALDIAGIFTTKLSINNVIQENASLTQESYKKRSGGKDILVNLTGASGSDRLLCLCRRRVDLDGVQALQEQDRHPRKGLRQLRGVRLCRIIPYSAFLTLSIKPSLYYREGFILVSY